MFCEFRIDVSKCNRIRSVFCNVPQRLPVRKPIKLHMFSALKLELIFNRFPSFFLTYGASQITCDKLKRKEYIIEEYLHLKKVANGKT